MDKDKIELLAELTAIRYVLEQVGKLAFIANGLGPEHGTLFRERAREVLDAESFPGVDASLSDHFSAEIATNVDEILSGIEAAVRNAYLQSGRPG